MRSVLGNCMVLMVSLTSRVLHPHFTLVSSPFVSANLPVARASVLKHTLRSMHRMMQSSGTAEGLRGLIDMSLLGSVKKIIANRGLFGPSVLPIGTDSFTYLLDKANP